MSYQSAYRKARQKALKEILEPDGFRKGKEMLVRRTNGQLHAIEFQPSKYGGEYFVNLAFSYEFLPPFLAALRDLNPPVEDYCELDFLLYTRIDYFLPKPHQRYGRYDDKGSQEIMDQVAQHARESVRILDGLGKQWSDPTVFLTLLPPDLVTADLQMRLARYQAEQKQLPWTETPFPFNTALGEAWHPEHFAIAFALALIAKAAEQNELATQYLRLAETSADKWQQGLLERLRRQLSA